MVCSAPAIAPHMVTSSQSRSGIRWRFPVFVALLAAPIIAHGGFGLVTTSTYYKVDTGAGMVFKIRRDNPSNTTSPGDIMSLIWNGREYQDSIRGSQLNSGFDHLYKDTSSVSVDAAQIGADCIKITVTAGSLVHYYMTRRGEPRIYMATYFTKEPDTVGLCRYILRLLSAALPNGPAPSDIRNNTGAIEAHDVFGMADGTTRSKHYSNMRLKDWSSIGATGRSAGIWIVRDNNEGGSGGPFYRCLLNQCSTDQEITYIVNYGEAQTEAFRTGILNSYTLVATEGAEPPASIDTSWFAGMGLKGYVAPSARGAIAGIGITNRDTNFGYTVALSNPAAQYWGTADPVTGAFRIGEVLPGIYTLRVFKNELSVYRTMVTIAVGRVTSLPGISISDDPARVAPVWRIGAWDGTPLEFLNGDKVTHMHPSDVRVAPWNPGPYVIGSSSPSAGFPCYQWRDINGDQTIQFSLSPSQLVPSTIRIGITTAYAGARPRITVNSWTSPIPPASTQPTSRTLTVGTYRGNNWTYSFSVPASALVAGKNILKITPVSGRGAGKYLSPGYSFDCVDFIQTAAYRDLPAIPSHFTYAVDATSHRVRLSWNVVANADSYEISRAISARGPFIRVASGLKAGTYSEPFRTDGGAHYRVVAENSSGAGLPASLTIGDR